MVSDITYKKYVVCNIITHFKNSLTMILIRLLVIGFCEPHFEYTCMVNLGHYSSLSIVFMEKSGHIASLAHIELCDNDY